MRIYVLTFPCCINLGVQAVLHHTESWIPVPVLLSLLLHIFHSSNINKSWPLSKPNPRRQKQVARQKRAGQHISMIIHRYISESPPVREGRHPRASISDFGRPRCFGEFCRATAFHQHLPAWHRVRARCVGTPILCTSPLPPAAAYIHAHVGEAVHATPARSCLHSTVNDSRVIETLKFLRSTGPEMTTAHGVSRHHQCQRSSGGGDGGSTQTACGRPL